MKDYYIDIRKISNIDLIHRILDEVLDYKQRNVVPDWKQDFYAVIGSESGCRTWAPETEYEFRVWGASGDPAVADIVARRHHPQLKDRDDLRIVKIPACELKRYEQEQEEKP